MERQPVSQEENVHRIGLLPHGYWKGTTEKGDAVLGLRSHLAAKAASLEQQAKEEEAQTRGEDVEFEIASPLEYLRGPKMMAKTMERYGTPASRIIDEGDAYSTWGK